jgi:hypothetical protein
LEVCPAWAIHPVGLAAILICIETVQRRFGVGIEGKGTSNNKDKYRDSSPFDFAQGQNDELFLMNLFCPTAFCGSCSGCMKPLWCPVSEVPCNLGGEKGPKSRGSMSLFGVLRLRLSQETAPNSAQDDEFDDEFNDEKNF